MEYKLKNKRQTPDWTDDFYLEYPMRDKSGTIIEKNDFPEIESNHNDEEHNIEKLTQEPNEYIEPTFYYF